MNPTQGATAHYGASKYWNNIHWGLVIGPGPWPNNEYGKEEETKRHLYDNEISFSRLEEKNKENRKQQNGSETKETRI